MVDDDDDEVVALRKKYDEALKRNQDAKKHLAKLLDESSNSAHRTGPPHSGGKDLSSNDELVNDLNLHLDILRSRKDYQRKQIIVDHLQRAEQVAKQHDIYSGPKRRPASRLDDINTEKMISELQQNLNVLLERSKRLTSNLESKLYEARQALKREQALLDQVHAEHSHAGEPPIAPQSKLHGLQAAKADLTSWIEDILARCEEPGSEPVPVNTSMPSEAHAPNMSKDDFEARLDAFQDRYVAARADLVAYTTALQDPVPERIPPAQDQPHRTANVRITQLQKQPQHNAEASLNALERRELPERTLRHILDTHVKHLRSELGSHSRSLAAELRRLSDESHLLPAYPVLAHDERFENARRVFGLGDEGRSERNATDDERAIGRLLGAWGFAAESAEQRNTESVRQQVEEGEGALRRAMDEIGQKRVLEGKVEEIGASV